MIPYYHQDNIWIYICDCREWLSGWMPVSCDVLISDPPYGINLDTKYESSGKRSILAQNRDYPAVHGDDKPFDPSHLLGFNRAMLWGGNYYAHLLPKADQWFCWDKRDGVVENDGSDCELAWARGTKGIGTRTFRHLWNGMLKDSERGERRYHPTQKPVALMSWCLNFFPKAKRIIDPYMGSGTTLVAAKLAGLSAVGIEVSEEYAEIAVKRLAQGVLFGAGPDCRLDCSDPKPVPHQPPPTPADALKTASMPLTSPEQGGALSKRLKDCPADGAIPTNSGATELHEKQGAQATGVDCVLDCSDGSEVAR